MPRAAYTKSTTPIEDKLFLTSAEAARLLNLTPITVTRKIKCGELKAAFVGRSWLIRRSDLDAYIGSKIETCAQVAA